MTDSDNPSIQTINELELNQQLQFDNDWEGAQSGSEGCHVCLKIDWESSTSRCVCLPNHTTNNHNNNVVI